MKIRFEGKVYDVPKARVEFFFTYGLRTWANDRFAGLTRESRAEHAAELIAKTLGKEKER